MVAMHIIKLSKGGKTIEGPTLVFADMEKLHELFPANEFWKCQRSSTRNVYFPTDAQAQALYEALISYYAQNDVSDEQYGTDDFIMGTEIGSSLLSVFDELLAFFEDKVGFTKNTETGAIIAEKQRRHAELVEERKALHEQQVIAAFAGLDVLRKPSDANHVARLSLKLEEYKRRKGDCHIHPDLAIGIDKNYRCTVFKIEVLEAVLALEEDATLNLRELVIKALPKKGFHATEYFFACAVIAYYLGTPFPGTDIKGSLPELAAA